MKARGYSLWFQPENNIYQEYDSIIRRLSEKYNTPYFEPHITLLGQIELSEEECLDKTKKLAFQLKPFTVNFSTIEFQNFYFRAMYVKTMLTPKLQRAYNHTCKIFNIKNPNKYMPHLSLLYGKFPLLEKKAMLENISSFLPGFKLQNISLIKSNGSPKDWEHIQTFSLNI